MSIDTTIQISQIGQIAVPIQDLDRAVAFYRDTLGMPFLFQAPPDLAFFQCGEVRLMLSRPEGAENS
ncbi:MAG: VOC family protein [Caldilineaceae bacterium]